MCLPGHDDGLVPRKIEGTVNVVKARMEHRRIGRDAWRARLEAGWGRDNQQNTTPSRHKRRFRDGRVLLERSCWPRGCAIARACGGGRFELFAKAAVLLPLLCFIAAVVLFRSVF